MKNKIAIIASLLFCINSFSCFAQSAYIKKVYAFYTISIAGNIAVDGNGTPLQNPSQTLYTIYIETNGKDIPTWDSATIGNNKYAVSTSTESKFPLMVGKLKNSENQFTINPEKSNHLIKVELQFGTPISGDFKPKPMVINLEGRYKNRKVSYVVKNAIELDAPYYP